MASGYLIAAILCLALFEYCNAGGHGGGHKKVIIHVPYKVKTIHHTHTIYKHIGGGGGGGGGDEGYKVIGYSGDGDVSLGHGEEVHPDVGEHAGGFVVGGDHGYWHSGGGGGDDGGHAAISLESSGGDWSGSAGGFSGGHGDLGGLGAYAGGHDLGGDIGGASLGGGHDFGGYDLSGGDSYGNSIASEGGHDFGGSIGGGGYEGGGNDGGHKGYD